MTGKIFRSTFLVAAVVLLCSLTLVAGVFLHHFAALQETQLRNELRLAATGTEQNGIVFLQNAASDDVRLTWVAPDGTVLFDSYATAAPIENHANREEITEALETGSGSSVRYSETLMKKNLYEAIRLNDGSVLRICISQASAAAFVLNMLQPILVVTLIAIALSAILARRMAESIVKPLNNLDLENPMENNAYRELTPLLEQINHLHTQVSSQVQTLQQKADEFEQITVSMKEGLVLLNDSGIILTINPTAKALYEADAQCIGQPFLTVDRSPAMKKALQTALAEGSSILHQSRNGREYQFELSRTRSGRSITGVVILAIDITETTHAEHNRREFTANVSHELKTPLQSIIGSAELLENNLVPASAIPRFVGHIRTEASRMVTLVEDILRLSQLDEGVDIPREDVELLRLASEVADSLQDAARSKEVTITVGGKVSIVKGSRRLLYEIIYNLCDNGIKYNIPGGRVDIRIIEKDGNTVLSVSDTGIGIPAEHHSRIFERFYRVDKSHSKRSGGTGLGLSIVKHAVAFHNAALELQSVPGTGTTITVTF